MNIHEYQAKQLLARYGVAVPLEIPAKSLDEVHAAAEKITAGGSARVVVKSQIHAGGRGKGTFKTGFQGGVKVASSVDEAVSHARPMVQSGNNPVDRSPHIRHPRICGITRPGLQCHPLPTGAVAARGCSSRS